MTAGDCINLKTHLDRDANTVARPLLVNNFDAILTFDAADCLRQIKLRRINSTFEEEKFISGNCIGLNFRAVVSEIIC